MLRNFFAANKAKIAEINARFAQPRLVISGPVRLALIALRLYLLLLVGLLVYKFVTLLLQ